jgi:molybdopterin-containing oxidoreductase family membrane subunit
MLTASFTSKAKVNDRLIDQLSHFIGWVLAAYLYFRFWDAFAMTYTYEPGRTEGLSLLTSGPLSFNFWVGEMLLGAVLPIIILLNPRLRSRKLLRMIALALVVGGVVAYRWDTNLTGQLVLLTYLPQEITVRYTAYLPSLIEFLVGAGIVAYGLMAFTLGARYLNVVNHEVAPEAEHQMKMVTAGTI